MAYIPESGSVVAFQSDPTKLVGTVSVVGILPVTQSGTNITSISGIIQSSVHGIVSVAGGTLAINDITPGSGALKLGKTIGSVASDGDVGIAILGKLEFIDNHTNDADGSYDNLFLTPWHELKTRDQREKEIANCNNASVFGVLGNDTTGLSDTADHVFGTGAITFNKVNGAGDTIFAGVDESFTAINFSNMFEDGSFVALGCKLPSIANVAYVFCRLGTDNANYNEWRWAVSSLTAAIWMSLRVGTNNPSAYAGAGWNTNAISYTAFGVAFNAETDTLDGIVFDNVHIISGRVTDTTLDTTISTAINTPNINLHRVGGTPTATNTGTVSAGTQRVTQATDVIVNTAGSVASHIKSGSVIAVLGGNTSVIAIQDSGWSGSVIAQIKSSVLTVISGNVPTTQLAGSVMAVSGSFSPAANQSVSGTVVIEQLAGSVLAVSGSFSPAANQSVSGTVHIDNLSSVISYQLAGSILAVNVSGLQGSSVSGTVGASIIGVAVVTSSVVGGIFPVSGSVATVRTGQTGTVVTSVVGGVSVLGGSVETTQIGAWTVSVVGTVGNTMSGAWTTSVVGNVGQIGTKITSVISSTPSSMLVGASIIGLTPVTAVITGNPSISGAVFVSGSVLAQQTGTVITSVVSSTPSSMLVGASIIGLTPVTVSGLQGSSISGTVLAQQSGTWATSIVGVGVIASIIGTYAEDAGHTSGNPGLFTLGVRNDAVASFAGANLDYAPIGVDSAGRSVIKPFAPEEARVEGYISLTSTSVTTLVAAGGAGIRNYITDAWFANTGSVSTLVTFKDGAGSVLGYTIAPAGGGSNINGLQVPIRTGANATFDVQAGSFTSTLYGTVKGFKAP